MTQKELNRLKRLCAAATPGPWSGKIDQIGRINKKADSLFIAAARDALPRLIDEIEDLRQAMADW